MDPNTNTNPEQNNPEQPVVVYHPTIITPSSAAEPNQPVAPVVAAVPDLPVIPTVAAPVSAATPAAGLFVSSPVTPELPVKKRPSKAWLLAPAVLLVLIGGPAAYYFGYYLNPAVVYQQSLANSGQGLDKLATSLTEKRQATYTGFVGSGSYKVNTGNTTTDGKLAFKSAGANSELSFDVGLGVSRVNVVTRTIKVANTTNPDVYVKASGITGLGALSGSAELGTIVDRLNDKWITVDHSLLDNLQQQAAKVPKTDVMPTRDQVINEVNAFTTVNKDYIFSTKSDKMVTKVLKTYGQETVDGHKVIHYQVGFVKANVSKYVLAQQAALKNSKLDDWITKNSYQEQVASSFKDTLQSVSKIKDSDTIEVWSDVSQRVIYKIRVADTKNPAANYVDVGMDYKGGDSFPFFVSGLSKRDGSDANFSLQAVVNSKTDAVTVKLTVKNSGSSKFTASGDLTFKPTNEAITVAVPTGALQLSAVLQQLGFGNILADYQPTAVPTIPKR